MKEIWKPAINIDENGSVNYLTNTEVSSLGRRKVNGEVVNTKSNQKYYRFKCDGKSYSIHRVVISTFQPNSDTYECINHKDLNTHNNCLNNLEWCTKQYNNNYADRNKRLSESLTGLYNVTGGCKIVCQYDNNKLINKYPSVREASRQTGICYRTISNVACGRQKTAGGYIWKYE